MRLKKKILREEKQIWPSFLSKVGFKVHVDPEDHPVTQPPRRISFHIRQHVNQELDNLEKQGIIQVDKGPPPRVFRVVAVP